MTFFLMNINYWGILLGLVFCLTIVYFIHRIRVDRQTGVPVINPISVNEFAIAFAVILLHVICYFLYIKDQLKYENMLMQEDGPIESATFFLYALSVVSLLSVKNKNTVSLVFLVIAFFIGGEEIAWGQRIFGIEPPAFIKEYNNQGEFTLHNTAFGAFIIVLLLCVPGFIYFFILPLADKSKYLKPLYVFCISKNIPLPRTYQTAILLEVLVIYFSFNSRVGLELVELGIAVILTSIILVELCSFDRQKYFSIKYLT